MRLKRMSLLSFHGRRLIYLCIVILIVYAVVHFQTQKEINTDRAAQLEQISKAIQQTNLNSHLWKGRQACRHPNLDVNNTELMKFVKDEGPIICSGEKDWVEITGNRAVITNEAKEKHGRVECSFTDILRTNDFTTHVGLTTRTHTEYNLESSDFVRVDCYGDSGKRWSSIMAGARYDQDLMDQTGWHLLPKDAMKLNVLMFGFDSISRNTFLRKLPQSYNYLTKVLNAVVLEGYNIVGDGTPQALIPILTGKTELELPDTRKRMGSKATYVNAYPFIWKNFKENGYITGFMEDTPRFGIFTYRLKGFDDSPTDHYMRPFYIDAESTYDQYSDYCIGSIPRHKVMLDYLKHIYRVYKDRPKFLFGFHGEISHDSYNLVGAADGDLKEWMEWLKNNGHLNNTLLVIMSDHGHRFAEIRNTQQGKVEERLPWFSFVVPPWFEKAYPQAFENLHKNSRRLTTPFDIYSTFFNVLHPTDFGKGDLGQRSISLFKEVPLERTCMDAYIEPHWCACLDWESVDRNDPIVQRAARAYVKFMNKYNSEFTDECAESQLHEVLWSARLVPSRALRKFHSSADKDGFVPNMSADTPVTIVMYQLKLTTLPGRGIFEMSLTHDISQDEFKFRIGDVSRINEYGAQSRCIEQTFEQLRKFCYCKDSF
ncbi:uncharacterized protein LOC106664528 isoform X2 [Cimex lectularius]|uniref:Uncharacterized protein n=1 Tax=Cimex lectularius TaxID=79782 RepID=A0A8I6RI75_CIMLE|nr:uncharacterized protein LOC106664528 isoform X2 [Cimex lectularius]